MQTKKQKSSSEEDWNKRYSRARKIINIIGIVIGVGFLIAAIILASSCSALKQKPVYITQRDSIYITQHDSTFVRDSVFIKDSVLIEKKQDTVYINKTVFQYKYKDRYKAIHDTLYLDKLKDTTIIQEVEKPFTKMQKATMSLGKIFIGVLIGFLVYLCWKLFRKFS